MPPLKPLAVAEAVDGLALQTFVANVASVYASTSYDVACAIVLQLRSAPVKLGDALKPLGAGGRGIGVLKLDCTQSLGPAAFSALTLQ